MSGDHNMRGEDDDEISTSTHFLPKPKTYGCDQNEFSPDWDQMAVLVTHSQEQAAKIEQLEKQVRDIQVTAIAEATEVDRLREALEQPEQEQEPVAGCACRWNHEDNRVVTCERHQGWLDVIAEWADRAREAEAKLKAIPPAAQRPWVGLTESDRNDLEDYFKMTIGKTAFDAIEAKLKERNT